jgi:putative transposase
LQVDRASFHLPSITNASYLWDRTLFIVTVALREQIVRVLKEAEAGVPVAELTRREGISDVTFYRWKDKFGGMEVNDARRLRELENENSRLKKIVA